MNKKKDYILNAYQLCKHVLPRKTQFLEKIGVSSKQQTQNQTPLSQNL